MSSHAFPTKKVAKHNYLTQSPFMVSDRTKAKNNQSGMKRSDLLKTLLQLDHFPF